MDKVIPLSIVFCITGLAIYALSKGIDGILLAGVFALLAGIGGYVAPHRKPPKK